MKRILLPIIIALFIFTAVRSQSVQKLNKTGSTEILLDKKIDDFGPNGHIYTGFGPNKDYDSITLTGYPKLKNLPDFLNMKVYTYIFDHKQFYYQNYRNGVYSKKYFKDYFKKQKYELRDTIKLTPKMVRCYFSFAVGYDRNKKMIFTIDTNGNNDLADEKLTQYKENILTDLVANSMNVAIESFNGVKIIPENTKCLLKLSSNSTRDQIEVSVSITQFRYAKITYEGEYFYVCSSYDCNSRSIYICEARPYFRDLSKDLEIKPYQIATFGKTYFKYEPISQNLDRIKLTSGFNDSDKKVLNAKPTIKETPRPLVSEQVEMLAPEITGINVQVGKVLSLNALRGKYVFLDFWATWCGPCVMEFPYIRKVFDTFSSDQLVILGICEDDYNGKIKSFLKDKQVTWPTIIKSASTTKTKGYNIRSFPTSFLIGPDGKIITTNLRGDDLFLRLENLKVKKK